MSRASFFYSKGLGFHFDREHPFEPDLPVFMQISRDGMTIYLSEHRGDCQPRGLVRSFVTDVDAWYQEVLCSSDGL
jgi:glyoxalase superfamily protein